MHFMLIVHLLACRCIKRKTIRLLRLRMVFVSQTFHWKQSTDTFFVALDRWVGLTAIEILEINNELILNICVFFSQIQKRKGGEAGKLPFFYLFFGFFASVFTLACWEQHRSESLRLPSLRQFHTTPTAFSNNFRSAAITIGRRRRKQRIEPSWMQVCGICSSVYLHVSDILVCSHQDKFMTFSSCDLVSFIVLLCHRAVFVYRPYTPSSSVFSWQLLRSILISPRHPINSTTAYRFESAL